MINHIVVNGKSQLKKSSGFQIQVQKLKQEIQLQYRDELDQGNFLKRLWIYFKMNQEFRKKRRDLEPSEHSLYLNNLEA